MVEKFLLVGYVAFITGLAASDVGEMPTKCGETFGWELPVLLAMLMLIPAALGYIAGRKDGVKASFGFFSEREDGDHRE